MPTLQRVDCSYILKLLMYSIDYLALSTLPKKSRRSLISGNTSVAVEQSITASTLTDSSVASAEVQQQPKTAPSSPKRKSRRDTPTAAETSTDIRTQSVPPQATVPKVPANNAPAKKRADSAPTRFSARIKEKASNEAATKMDRAFQLKQTMEACIHCLEYFFIISLKKYFSLSES
jgi:hypothetical protein